MLAQKTRIFYYVHKPKQPTALIYFKRLASRVRCSFCKGVFNLCYTTLLGLKGNMCLRRMSVSRSKRLNKEIPDRCWRKALCAYNSETRAPNNLVCRAQEKSHVRGTERQVIRR